MCALLFLHKNFMRWLFSPIYIVIVSCICTLFMVWAIQTNSFWQNTSFQKTELDSSQKFVWNNMSTVWFYPLEEEIVDMINASKQSVVSIIATKEMQFLRNNSWEYSPEIVSQIFQVGWWSGVYIHEDGYVLTNKHVVDNSEVDYTIVFEDWSETESTQVRLDPILDLAVLRIDTSGLSQDIPPAKIVSFNTPIKIWQFTFAVWNSLSRLANSVTFGILSWKNRSIFLNNDSLNVSLYQTDAAISRWNSWWPLFNSAWEIIGINTAVSAIWENIWFSLPIHDIFVDNVINQIELYNEIQKPFLGINREKNSYWLSMAKNLSTTQWIYVSQLADSSPAFSAWLLPGDVILALDWKDIDDSYPLLYQLYKYNPWDIIQVHVLRDATPLYIDIELWKNDMST